MNDVYQQILSYLGGMWRGRWYAVALAWVVCGFGWTVVASLPDRYQSSARIYVDMDTMLGPLMKGIAVEMNLFQQIDIMRRTLMSRPNLEKIILMTDLDLSLKTDEAKEAMAETLRRKISVRQQGRNLFQISYEDENPDLAKRVVQAVMQVFVEGNLGASRKDMETTQRFLVGQIRDYERQLVAAEKRLADFKRDNMALLPGKGTNYYQYMQNIMARLEQTEAQIGEAETIRDQLRQQIKQVPKYLEVASQKGAGGIGDQGPRGPKSDISIRILELQNVIDTLLARYTDQHPDVISARRQLETLQKQLEAAAQAGPDSGRSVTMDPDKSQVSNPVYEQIKLQLVQQEGVIAALSSRAKTQRAEVAKWRGMAQLVPQVEAQLVQLNRDYQIYKKGYDQLRARLESAKLAKELDTKAQKVQFRVIDPPKLPAKPSGPNRPRLFGVVLLFGIGVGAGFALLLSQINTTFSTVHRLRSTFTLPVLGRISTIMSPRERRQRAREMAGFAFVCLCLIVAFGGLVGIELLGTAQLLGKIKSLGII